MLGVIRLLLALQATALVGHPNENDALQTKTPSIQSQGSRHVAAHEDPQLLNNDVYEVGFAEGGEALRGTGEHPLYSLDRDDWVRIRDLQDGERLQTAEGAVTIEALEKVRGVHRVYNLEVEGDHEYLVGEAGVQAHNSCLDDVLDGATPGRATKGRTTQYEKPGGVEQANTDFDRLDLEDVKDIPGGRVGQHSGGETVVVRSKSSDGRATLEAQKGKNRTKIRYDGEPSQ